MRKLKNTLLVLSAAIAIVGSLLSANYTFLLADRLEQVRRSNYADTIYLRGRIRELENELTAGILDRLAELCRPVGGDGENAPHPNLPSGDAVPLPETESDPDTAPFETEASTTAPDLPTQGDAAGEHEQETDAPVISETHPTADSRPVDCPETTDTEQMTAAAETDSIITAPESESEAATPTPETEAPTSPEIDTTPETKDTAAEPTIPPESTVTTEEVTLPTHQSPETMPSETRPVTPEEPSKEPDQSLDKPVDIPLPTEFYVVCEQNGRIGVFDETGNLIRTVNVFVFTLPEADRHALEVGIVAYSKEELSSIIEKYE